MKSTFITFLFCITALASNIEFDSERGIVTIHNPKLMNTPFLAVSSAENAENDREYYVKSERARKLCRSIGFNNANDLEIKWTNANITLVDSFAGAYVNKYFRRVKLRSGSVYNIASITSVSCLASTQQIAKAKQTLQVLGDSHIVENAVEKLFVADKKAVPAKVIFTNHSLLAATAGEHIESAWVPSSYDRAERTCKQQGFSGGVVAYKVSWQNKTGHALEITPEGRYIENQFEPMANLFQSALNFYWSNFSLILCSVK